jgi:hypothetical protein
MDLAAEQHVEDDTAAPHIDLRARVQPVRERNGTKGDGGTGQEQSDAASATTHTHTRTHTHTHTHTQAHALVADDLGRGVVWRAAARVEKVAVPHPIGEACMG